MIEYPGVWYRTQSFHVLICVALFALGAWAHRSAVTKNAEDAAFDNVTVYSKPACELCDRAVSVLREFGSAIPTIEVVDISEHEELLREHAESVPVVEIDGVVRFRGIVNRELLQRLIDAEQRRPNKLSRNES